VVGSSSSRALFRTSHADTTARKTYDLIDEPVGLDYDALIDAAIGQCSTAVLVVREGDLEPPGVAVLEELKVHLGSVATLAAAEIHRYAFNRDTAGILKRAARGLYAWAQPSLPADLSLLRPDDSPWLISIGAERVGYLELAPFDKLILGRAAPGLAAVLAHEAAREAILAVFERSLEARQNQLTQGLVEYGGRVVEEGREGLVSALEDWLDSGEQTRVVVALDVASALRLHELLPAVRRLHRAAVAGDTEVPRVYRSNLVLRERWKAGHRRELERALSQLS